MIWNCYPGLEAVITDPKENSISVKNAEIVVESRDDERIQVRLQSTCSIL